MIDFAELKRFFMFNLIGSLVLAAIVAVATVLMGEFNDVTMRVFLTLFMVVLHSFISLSFIWDDSRQNTFEKLAFFINTLFILIVLSFITSILGVWLLISGATLWKIYSVLIVLGFAALHGDILSKALSKEDYIDKIIYANYFVMAIVVLMILPIIFRSTNYDLGEMYYRILAAVSIIDGTLSILTIIFYKLYMSKHPKEENPLQSGDANTPAKKAGLSIWVWLLIGYLVVQVFFPMVFYAIFRRGMF